MNCTETQSLLSEYLDGVLNGKAMHAVGQHLRTCATCRQDHAFLVQTQSMMASLGRKPAPVDLALRIKVAVSRQRGVSFERKLQGFLVRFENAFNTFMLPATAGLVTAVLMFGLFVGFFVGPRAVSASNDVPTSLYTPPKLSSMPMFGLPDLSAEGPVVIEAFVDSSGRVESYRIISGDDNAKLRKQLDQSLLFTVFEPAMSFGQPASGRLVISFANVSVKG